MRSATAATPIAELDARFLYFSPVLFADFVLVQFDDGLLDMPPFPRPNPPESV